MALAVVFLVVALVVPVYVLYDTITSNLREYVRQLPTLQDQPNANDFFTRLSASQQTLMAILVVVEAVFVVLFAVAMWYALRCREKDRCRTYPVP